MISAVCGRSVVVILAGIVVAIIGGCGYAVKDIRDPEFTKKYSDYVYCNVPLVRQQSAKSCGLACLSAVSYTWGLDVDESDLVSQIPGFEHKNGLSLSELKNVGKESGLTCFALLLTHYPMELTEHLRLGRPVICALEIPKHRFGWANTLLLTKIRHSIASWLVSYKNHFVVVYGFNEADRKLLIMDPAHGYVTMGYDEFREYWKEKTFAALLCAK